MTFHYLMTLLLLVGLVGLALHYDYDEDDDDNDEDDEPPSHTPVGGFWPVSTCVGPCQGNVNRNANKPLCCGLVVSLHMCGAVPKTWQYADALDMPASLRSHQILGVGQL